MDLLQSPAQAISQAGNIVTSKNQKTAPAGDEIFGELVNQLDGDEVDLIPLLSTTGIDVEVSSPPDPLVGKDTLAENEETFSEDGQVDGVSSTEFAEVTYVDSQEQVISAPVDNSMDDDGTPSSFGREIPDDGLTSKAMSFREIIKVPSQSQYAKSEIPPNEMKGVKLPFLADGKVASVVNAGVPMQPTDMAQSTVLSNIHIKPQAPGAVINERHDGSILVTAKSEYNIGEIAKPEVRLSEVASSNPTVGTPKSVAFVDAANSGDAKNEGSQPLQLGILGDSREGGVRLTETASGLRSTNLGAVVAGPPSDVGSRASQATFQVAQAMSNAETQDIEVRLDPAELGKVRIIMSARDGQMVAVITAERPETLDLLRKNAEQLEADFADQGFTDANLSFGQQDQDEAGDHSQMSEMYMAEQAQNDAEHSAVQAVSAVSADGLDIRL
ncbi:MAG: flagellar hook-length control protein FliK [Litoreibacter sp.]